MLLMLATGTFDSDSFESFAVAIVMDLGLRRNRVPKREVSRHCTAKGFVLGAIVVGELLSLGTATAQVRADTPLPVAPSTIKHPEISTSVFALPQKGNLPQVPAAPPAVPDRGLALLVKRGARDQKEF